MVLTSSLLAGCTAVAPPGSRPPAAASVNLMSGSELGNGRPQVSYDGLMVRRRIAVAIHPVTDADLEPLRAALASAAGSLGLALVPIAPDVLGASVLEHTVPQLVVALPSDASVANGSELVDVAFGPDQAFPGLDHVHVVQVLVHDLRFTVSTDNPAAVAESVAGEGILADSLGNYEARPGYRQLEVSYTGPLLSDKTVQAVRVGIARGAGNAPDDVVVAPRSYAGAGVDMENEPAEPPVAEEPTDADSNRGH